MAKNSSGSINNRETNPLLKNIVIGAAIGGFAGAISGILDEIGLHFVPKLPLATPSSIVNGTALGIIIGGGIGAVAGLYVNQPNINDTAGENISQQIIDKNQDVNIQIREEQLDIAKKLIQTGEVTVHKEVLTEEKNLVVPVTREELVIEKKVLDTDQSPDKSYKHIETLRIPISEDRIEVTKHPVILNNVSINKRKFQEIKRVEGTLKKEKIHLETIGTPKVIDKDT